MSSCSIVVPYTSSVGSKFLISFKEFESQDKFSIPVIDLTLVLVETNDKAIQIKDLIAISRIVKDYLETNKVVLYYYCDHSSDGITISKRHLDMSSQKYRSDLFNTIFDFMRVSVFVKDDIIIFDSHNNESHYISLITKVEDRSSLTEVSIKVQEINDK